MATKATPKKGKARRDWKFGFLKALGENPNVSEAATAAKVSRQHAYRARQADPEFAGVWDDVLESSVDELVQEARKRALLQSDTLLIFLLKSHRPKVYRETVRRELSGPEGGPIETKAIDEDQLLDKLEQMAGARRARPAPTGKPKKRRAARRPAKRRKSKPKKPVPRPLAV